MLDRLEGGLATAALLFASAALSSAMPVTIEFSVEPSAESPTAVVVEARNTSGKPISLEGFLTFELRPEGETPGQGFWAPFSFRGDHSATPRNRTRLAIEKDGVVRADISLANLDWSLLPRSNWWMGHLRSVVPPGRYRLVVIAESSAGRRFESAPVPWVAKP